jgi:hypothetical protein
MADPTQTSGPEPRAAVAPATGSPSSAMTRSGSEDFQASSPPGEDAAGGLGSSPLPLRSPAIALSGSLTVVEGKVAELPTTSEVGLTEAPEKEAPEWERKIYGQVTLSSGPLRKRRPPVAEQRRLLEEQAGRCFYCQYPFGEIVTRRGRPVILKLQWDHVIPFSYSNENSGYVAACHVCNHIKEDRIFDSPVAAQDYVKAERFRRGYRGVMP